MAPAAVANAGVASAAVTSVAQAMFIDTRHVTLSFHLGVMIYKLIYDVAYKIKLVRQYNGIGGFDITLMIYDYSTLSKLVIF